MAWFTAKGTTDLVVLILTLSPWLFAFVISAEITCGCIGRVIVIIRLIITSILLLVVLLITLVSGLLIRGFILIRNWVLSLVLVLYLEYA